MEGDSTLLVLGIIAAAALVTVWALTHVIVTLRWKGRTMQALSEKKVEEALRKQQAETLQQQIASVRAEMTARTETILKEREEELSRKARETFEGISGGLSKDLSAMKDTFEAGKKAQAEDAAALRERFDAAVRDLEARSREIGGKADHLAEALRGRKKLQGCWGETVLANILADEGLVEGRDYDKESTLRDEMGFVLVGEDSEKRMRPDFILHLPDNNDIVIDAKVSLAAFTEYVESEDPEVRADASRRNAEAVREQAKRLARKGYERYLRPGRRMLDYVVMFVPNYPALQLAYTEDPALWRDAYAQGVLITSEETLMPFLRMISIAWTHVEQVRNQQQIIASAQTMIDRVADFAKAHAEMGRKLTEAQDCYDRCADKLKDSGRSIVQSARQIVKLGVPANPKKPLPEE
jgi:DNA recombination protein RmuC